VDEGRFSGERGLAFWFLGIANSIKTLELVWAISFLDTGYYQRRTAGPDVRFIPRLHLAKAEGFFSDLLPL
jgi:hypothetical protein